MTNPLSISYIAETVLASHLIFFTTGTDHALLIISEIPETIGLNEISLIEDDLFSEPFNNKVSMLWNFSDLNESWSLVLDSFEVVNIVLITRTWVNE